MYWVSVMRAIAGPVLEKLVQRQLKRAMPVERKTEERLDYSHLEAFARTLTGLAPWLESVPVDPEERALRDRYADLARQAIDAATDPDSPDYMNFGEGAQPIVDAAFLAHAILRAPIELGEKLEPTVKQHLVNALKATRTRKPFFSNWLLFSAMIETALFRMDQDWDPMRIDYALKQHEQWYLGDGIYGDGPEYHADYYNSFVIQPMLIDVVEHVAGIYPDWDALRDRIVARAIRHASVLERSISPEGTFPVIGRSLAYRFGVFQLLSQIALRKQLQPEIAPSQVRCALTSVMRRMIEAEGTFDDDGWLRIGFCGHQPELGETYISTGSLYLCSTVFLPLGLPESDPFWADEPRMWTSQQAWSGSGYFKAIDQAL
ncbi:DUF2264 domain-containing protein [Cohnella nanjingensis]|nr:DUF2264 domain-containing protein [Cohnella nanjingensis]